MTSPIDKLKLLKSKYSSYKIIDITYDATALIKFSQNNEPKFKEHILLLGCPLHFYLVISNDKDIILIKYKTIRYHFVGQITYFLNNRKIFYEKDFNEWKKEQLEFKKRKYEEQQLYHKIKTKRKK